MLIVETPVFTRRIVQLLPDDEYRLLQQQLIADPERGKLIRGSGGLRKVRWSASGRGKSGGVRIIYYWAPRPDVILMLLAYAKNEQEDLSPDQLKLLKRFVETEFP